jgi:hypothetical protein
MKKNLLLEEIKRIHEMMGVKPKNLISEASIGPKMRGFDVNVKPAVASALKAEVENWAEVNAKLSKNGKRATYDELIEAGKERALRDGFTALDDAEALWYLAKSTSRDSYGNLIGRMNTIKAAQIEKDLASEMSNIVETAVSNRITSLFKQASDVDLAVMSASDIEALKRNLLAVNDNIDSSISDIALRDKLKQLVKDQIDVFETGASKNYATNTPAKFGTDIDLATGQPNKGSSVSMGGGASAGKSIDFSKSLNDQLDLLDGAPGMDRIPADRKSLMKENIKNRFGSVEPSQIPATIKRAADDYEQMLEAEIKKLEQESDRLRKEGKTADADAKAKAAENAGRAKKMLSGIKTFCFGKQAFKGFGFGQALKLGTCTISGILAIGLLDSFFISGALDALTGFGGDRGIPDYLCFIVQGFNGGDNPAWLENKGWCEGRGLDEGGKKEEEGKKEESETTSDENLYSNTEEDFERFLEKSGKQLVSGESFTETSEVLIKDGDSEVWYKFVPSDTEPEKGTWEPV